MLTQIAERYLVQLHDHCNIVVIQPPLERAVGINKNKNLFF